MVWAWFGAGKTHALRYFCHLCKNGPQKLTCVYTEFPKGVKSFVDLYRAFSFEMEIDSIKEAFTEILTSPSSEEYLRRLRSISQDFEKAGRALVLGTGEQPDYAMRWLRGENIPLKDLRTLGMNARISSTEDALRVLRCIVFLEASAAKSQGRMGRQRGVRLEVFVDIGLLEKEDPTKYTYRFTPFGTEFMRDFIQAPNLESFLMQHFFESVNQSFGCNAKPFHDCKDRFLELLLPGHNLLASGLGYAPLHETLLLTILRNLGGSQRVYFELSWGIEAVKELQRAYPDDIKFNINRQGEIRYVKFSRGFPPQALT